ncbi:hypothetical protein ACSBR2_030815 [Camellia fascicularis]
MDRDRYSLGPSYELRSFRVHITSEVPDTPGPLKIHCKSRDNDLGEQLVNNCQDFHWSFKENLFGTTLFFCGFGWNGKIQSFDVFPIPWMNIVIDHRSRGFVSG